MLFRSVENQIVQNTLPARKHKHLAEWEQWKAANRPCPRLQSTLRSLFMPRKNQAAHPLGSRLKTTN